ncbi:MAG: transposase [Thermaerobacter sp.]|nr:transposase [Thermaerobacter sp.]
MDFAHHIAAVVDLHPNEAHVVILDNLNTHQSEALVRFAIAHDHLPVSDVELGEKGRFGILASQATQKRFLENTAHRVRFLYMPKHCSWLNQIECWVRILVRKHLLNKRASFSPLADLEARIRQFMVYYNKHFAKPFRWTFDGKLLKV